MDSASQIAARVVRALTGDTAANAEAARYADLDELHHRPDTQDLDETSSRGLGSEHDAVGQHQRLIAPDLAAAPQSKSSDLTTTLGNKTLREIEQQIEAAYLIRRADVSSERILKAFEPMRIRLGKRFDEVFSDSEVLAIYPELHAKVIGDTTIADYAAAQPSAGVIAWWQGFIESAVDMIHASLEDSLSHERESAANRSSAKLLGQDAQVSSSEIVVEDSPTSLRDIDRELDDVAVRLSAELRAKRPDLFDGSGRPKKGALEKAVQEHTGKKKLTRADILALLRKKSS